MRNLSWQATFLLIALLTAITGSFLVVFFRDGIGSALGTLAVFGLLILAACWLLGGQMRLSDTISRLEQDLSRERGREATATERSNLLQQRNEAILAHADQGLIDTLKASDPTLFTS